MASTHSKWKCANYLVDSPLTSDILHIRQITHTHLSTITWAVNAHKYHKAGKFGGGKFGEFGESFVIHQTKTMQVSTYN